MQRRMTPDERTMMKEAAHAETTIRWENKHGKKRCRASENLKPTQSYPMPFGCAHALAYQAHVAGLAGEDQEPTLIGSSSEDEFGDDPSNDPCLQDLVKEKKT